MLIKTYNPFHNSDLDLGAVAAALAKSGGAGDPEDCLARIRELGDLHARMDRAVLKAYAWVDFDPDHGFHELDFLPENDRVRFTIGPAVRREVLERFLELNWRRHKEEGGEYVLVGKEGALNDGRTNYKPRGWLGFNSH